MNHIIQTGTDSEGAAVTTTLNVQMTYTFAYLGHECQNFVNNQLMPLRREKDMVKQVKVRVTGTDGTTANASFNMYRILKLQLILPSLKY